MSCKYCGKNEENIHNRLPREMNGLNAKIENQNAKWPRIIVHNLNGDVVGVFPIRNCPMCGRKLIKEN